MEKTIAVKQTHRCQEEKTKLIHRLNRMEGQIRGIKGMLEEDAYCVDILMQSAAVSAAISSFHRELLDSHIRTCVVEGIQNDQLETVEELITILQKLVK